MERRNGILSNMIVRSATKPSEVRRILPSYDMVVNTMANTYEFSPYQLVIGKNPRLPGIMTNGPKQIVGYGSIAEAYEGYLPKHLHTLQTMREEYYKVEGMERLKRAGNKVLRRFPDDRLPGDVALYYTKEMNKSVQP